MRARRLSLDLAEWRPPHRLEALRDEYLGFLDLHGEEALERGRGPEHVTAS
ncbi:hypothetical protein [Rathayibacter oskolensis]|uniref:hypothetical protein n=1 Tax=Rathayibacter oskolensis TaxID=1891671 RepID=UPI0013FD7F93|nr:hypothetical protein [Rathayibacter oskolensis]